MSERQAYFFIDGTILYQFYFAKWRQQKWNQIDNERQLQYTIQQKTKVTRETH